MTSTQVREQLSYARTTLKRNPPDPFIVVIDFWVGIALIVGSGGDTSSAVLQTVQLGHHMTLVSWGVLYLLLGCLIVAALVARHRYRLHAFDALAATTRIVGPGLYAFWAVAFAIAAITVGNPLAIINVATFTYLGYRHATCPVPGMTG